MATQPITNTGKNLAAHRGEWLVLDSDGSLIAHAPKLKDCMKEYEKVATTCPRKNPSIYWSPFEGPEIICTTL